MPSRSTTNIIVVSLLAAVAVIYLLVYLIVYRPAWMQVSVRTVAIVAIAIAVVSAAVIVLRNQLTAGLVLAVVGIALASICLYLVIDSWRWSRKIEKAVETETTRAAGSDGASVQGVGGSSLSVFNLRIDLEASRALQSEPPTPIDDPVVPATCSGTQGVSHVHGRFDSLAWMIVDSTVDAIRLNNLLIAGQVDNVIIAQEVFRLWPSPLHEGRIRWVIARAQSDARLQKSGCSHLEVLLPWASSAASTSQDNLMTQLTSLAGTHTLTTITVEAWATIRESSFSFSRW